ncbi:hypothetical protein PR202_ga20032 [Eleusine coracana subsp. coracana]|uniref:Uncharacterized protein n=1 Tax=Eleusine coracana subsp. coracana TaxID=191504 RepID=A0AAV5CX54_ELECO|nr:hypothetical protein PR202_ga20032 [Eleusine coracana subsp. coracana]
MAQSSAAQQPYSLQKLEEIEKEKEAASMLMPLGCSPACDKGPGLRRTVAGNGLRQVAAGTWTEKSATGKLRN